MACVVKGAEVLLIPIEMATFWECFSIEKALKKRADQSNTGYDQELALFFILLHLLNCVETGQFHSRIAPNPWLSY